MKSISNIHYYSVKKVHKYKTSYDVKAYGITLYDVDMPIWKNNNK